MTSTAAHPLGAPAAALSLPAWLAGEIEAQARRWFLWAPVAFGSGCAVYMTLQREPPAWAGLLLIPACAAVVAAARWGRRGPLIAALLLSLFVGGVAAGQWRTANVRAPVLREQTTPVRVEGWVVDLASPGAGGARLVIAPTRLGAFAPEELPDRIRVTVDAERAYGPGTAVRLSAILSPPPGPASPGAYDFARDAFFERIGGVGFALRQPEPIDLGRPEPLGLRLLLRLNEVR